MKERPILFSSEMVNAILHGTANTKAKTQTRRTKGLEVINEDPEKWSYWYSEYFCKYLDDPKNFYHFKDKSSTIDDRDYPRLADRLSAGDTYTVKCPFNFADRLWVKETFLFDLWYSYKADYYENELSEVKWKPAIHMPREASRITLKIQNIRVERLQDITDADAIAEGVVARNYSAKEGYLELWDSIHGKDAHKLNPFVWVIEFKRMEGEK